MTIRTLLLGSVLACGTFAASVDAKVSQAEADKLGKSLTPFGSIMEGNEAGTIPAWNGGLKTPPAGYEGAGHHHVDPFPDDKIKFSIDKSNYPGFEKYMTPGQYALMEAYPNSFSMDVYPTRRTHAMPDWVNQNTKENATTATLSKGGVGINDAYGGIPFPILHGSNQDKALQAIWNHLTRWRGIFLEGRYTEVAVQRDGRFTPITKQQEVFFNFHNPEGSFKEMDNILFYFLTFNKAPARLAGGALLVHETLDQSEDARQAWDYNAGQRRVRRAPNLAYDSPIASSDNTRTADDTDMYNGAPDRYDWEYKGVQEIFIPYNNYKIGREGVKYDDLVMPGHLNPEYVRWELHRVHVVEANLKKGARHIYKKRVFYIDEDSWSIALVDQYDNRGELWRVSAAMLKNYYELPGTWTTSDVFHDLQSRRYSVNGLYSEERQAPLFESKVPGKRYFKPQSLRRRAR
ncbi:hypothetical protein A3715_01255 [Oleiphilus sp. HI0009]|nr:MULTISPECIES: DUF1329 domain-containing protein [unclassified Oleiphilus]KZX82409.1 hypothetical protein A3715_01255 [Oleiphilus sp. HI0009]MCH2159695.1 DUF1329 domain-containing protein [Oleiphilaceae bacterium]KZY67864.1 hypothetical protein A3739_11730 [Oleiphilus sp. HI0067]KZY72196.1 hypothetical protein A3738_14265 [Oleiphilus sp. HI0066]KZZ62619.1 hypothetical protein A3762_13075 [Oleiphilus sp. HI0125]